MNLTSILAELYRRTNNGTSPATDVVTRFTSFVNESHRRILTKPGMEKLRDSILTFASVADRETYGLPPSIARIKSITQRDNMRRLRFLSLDQLRTLDPGLTASGTPDFWVQLGYQAVSIQPSNASELFVKSDSASDGATKTVFLEGLTTGGYLRSASVALNGLTAVSIGATITSWIAVTKFYIALSAAGNGATTAAGNITLLEDSGAGTELARIPIGQAFSRYMGVQLYPTPASAETFYADITRVIPDMSQATDEPLLPEDFHWLLVTMALKREYEKKDDDRYRQAVLEETEGIKALRNWVLYPPDYDATPQTTPISGSNLGGFYPEGRW